MWMSCFVYRYKDEVSKFLSVCTKGFTIITKEDEHWLLIQMQEILATIKIA